MLSNIYKNSVMYIFACVLFLGMGMALVACSDASGGNGGGTAQGNKSSRSTQTGGTTGATTTSGTPNSPTAVSGTSKTSGNGPVVISSPTPVSGGGVHSQQVVLSDRTLIINDVTQTGSASAATVTITLSVEVKNTGSKAIMNQSAYYFLSSSEGDSFGVTSTPTTSFYGTIGASNSHSGTLIFQIPSAAAKGLRLFYHPEVATDTTFLPIVLN